MSRTATVGFAVFAFLFVPLSSRAQIGGSASHPFNNAFIQVQVRMPDGSPAPQGVMVRLEAEDFAPIDQGQTDSSGRCRFVPPAPAVYFVKARLPGYLEASQRIDLQNIQTGMAFLTLKSDPRALGAAKTSEGPGSTSAADLAVPDPARKEFDKGQKALQDKDLDGGITHLKEAIRLYPTFPQAYTLLGTAYNEQKKWKEAEAALQRATEIDPKASGAYLQLGAALNQTKDYPGAVKALTQGLTLNPDAPEAPAAQYELARAYMAQNRWQDAEPYAAKVVAAQPDFAAGHLLMGNIYLKKNDGNGALKEFQAYLRIDPKGPAAEQIKEMIPKIQAAMKK
jgi:tetratricopeptide (TPR) repeat protein